MLYKIITNIQTNNSTYHFFGLIVERINTLMDIYIQTDWFDFSLFSFRRRHCQRKEYV